MTDPEPSLAIPDQDMSSDPDTHEATREAAMMRKMIREQERHREGGVEPELATDDDATDPRP